MTCECAALREEISELKTKLELVRAKLGADVQPSMSIADLLQKYMDGVDEIIKASTAKDDTIDNLNEKVEDLAGDLRRAENERDSLQEEVNRLDMEISSLRD